MEELSLTLESSPEIAHTSQYPAFCASEPRVASAHSANCSNQVPARKTSQGTAGERGRGKRRNEGSNDDRNKKILQERGEVPFKLRQYPQAPSPVLVTNTEPRVPPNNVQQNTNAPSHGKTDIVGLARTALTQREVNIMCFDPQWPLEPK